VYLEDSPRVDKSIFNLGIPILGICYGMQLMVTLLRGKVVPAQSEKGREYGKTITTFNKRCPIFQVFQKRVLLG